MLASLAIAITGLATFTACNPGPISPSRRPPHMHAGPELSGHLLVDWWYPLHVPIKDEESGEYLFPSKRPANASSMVEPFRFREQPGYLPMPQPSGQYGPGYSGWLSWVVDLASLRVAESGAPVGILLRNRNVPFPYRAEGKAVDRNALRDALSTVPKLDFVFMDLEYEPDMIMRNTAEVIRAVRSHRSQHVKQAYVGNYDDYPGRWDPANPWERNRDRRQVGSGWDREAFYETGLNVAMPSAYPYEMYSVHSKPQYQRESGATPNDRAAMLWAPLARVAVAKRNLPAGHLLVPWVSNYVTYKRPDPNGDYDAAPPPREDLEAMIAHIRLRGADGYVLWTSDNQDTEHPDVDYETYRALTLDAWRQFDEYFPVGGQFEVLNLDDPKTSGLIWSGMASEDHVVVYVSNLAGDGQARSVNLPPKPGIPSTTDPVADGTHQMFIYPLGRDGARGAAPDRGPGNRASDAKKSSPPKSRPVLGRRLQVRPAR